MGSRMVGIISHQWVVGADKKTVVAVTMAITNKIVKMKTTTAALATNGVNRSKTVALEMAGTKTVEMMIKTVEAAKIKRAEAIKAGTKIVTTTAIVATTKASNNYKSPSTNTHPQDIKTNTRTAIVASNNSPCTNSHLQDIKTNTTTKVSYNSPCPHYNNPSNNTHPQDTKTKFSLSLSSILTSKLLQCHPSISLKIGNFTKIKIMIRSMMIKDILIINLKRQRKL